MTASTLTGEPAAPQTPDPPLRVLHCPSTVGGHPQQLARSERALGLASLSVTLDPNAFNYTVDESLYRAGERGFAREIRRLRLLWRALRHFDVIHYNFGSTIMPVATSLAPSSVPGRFGIRQKLHRLYGSLFRARELEWLKRAGKSIVVTYQGDDARQRDYSLANFEISIAQEVGPEYYPPGSDPRKRDMIKHFDRYADRIYALNPDLLHVLPQRARFLPYAITDLSQWTPTPTPPGKKLTLLHAPSHRGAKGTRFIVEAVKRLQEEDRLDFDFTLVEGLSHAEARPLYEKADLLVDQLLAGWYGGLAVELMALGKPVICYIRQDDLKFIPEPMSQDLPMIQATPQSIYAVLKEWIGGRRDELPEIGRRSRTFVERWHDPLKVGAELKADYETLTRRPRQQTAPVAATLTDSGPKPGAERVLVISAHQPYLDRRIVAEINALVASGREVTLASVPVRLEESGLSPKTQLAMERRPPGTWYHRLRAFGKRFGPLVFAIGRNILYRFHVGPEGVIRGHLLRTLPMEPFDRIHCHDLETLPAAVEARNRFSPLAKILYDSHELCPFQTDNRRLQRYWSRLENHYIREADRIITVNDSIADHIAENYRVDRPTVIYNSLGMDGAAKELSREDFLAHFGVSDSGFNILLQGSMAEGRNMESLVRAFGSLDNDCRLLILGDGPLLPTLRREIKALPTKNVFLGDRVSQEALLSYVRHADMGIIPYVGNGILNYYYCTPNKLFEYIEAEVPVCGSDLPELRKIIQGTGIGKVYTMETTEQIAEAIRDCIARCRKGEFTESARAMARDRFAWSEQAKTLLDLYASLESH